MPFYWGPLPLTGDLHIDSFSIRTPYPKTFFWNVLHTSTASWMGIDKWETFSTQDGIPFVLGGYQGYDSKL